jgi:hypothetical protein
MKRVSLPIVVGDLYCAEFASNKVQELVGLSVGSFAYYYIEYEEHFTDVGLKMLLEMGKRYKL